MKGYLLDTNVAVLGLVEPSRIPLKVQKLLESRPLFLSVISFCEVAIKSMKGNLRVGEPRLWWLQTLQDLGATPVLLRPDHVSAVCTLPPLHRDPFDRILIAQAVVEELTLVTTDRAIPSYPIRSIQFPAQPSSAR